MFPQKKKKRNNVSPFVLPPRHRIYFVVAEFTYRWLNVGKDPLNPNSYHMKSSMFSAGNHILRGRLTRLILSKYTPAGQGQQLELMEGTGRAPF